MKCLLELAFVAGFLAFLPPLAKGASPQQVKWESLSIVVGRTVSIAMPGGAVISGKATGVEPDALVVQVAKTADPRVYPKGPLRVPRATLRTLEMQTKGHKFRVIGTALGGVAGFAGGLAAAIGIQGGILGNKHQGAAVGAAFAITAGGAVAGYLAGNAADRRSTTIEILP